VRCKARTLRKPEAYMMAYGEDFRSVRILLSAGQIAYIYPILKFRSFSFEAKESGSDTRLD
jgi:hypothetical protein